MKTPDGHTQKVAGAFLYRTNVLKMPGGYLPRIAGRPRGTIDEIPVPERLHLSLRRAGRDYSPIVSDGQDVAFGDPLAEAIAEGGTLSLPSPASGKVLIATEKDGGRRLVLEVSGQAAGSTAKNFERFDPQTADPDAICKALARGGVWPFFWSSRSGGMPGLGTVAPPRTIVVNCVVTEPFRARGKTILRDSWPRIVRGIKFLQRLVAKDGTIEIVLASESDLVSRMLYVGLSDHAGHSWFHFRPAPRVYPIENPMVLSSALRRADPSLGRGDDIWVIDVQGVAAVGACLSEGLPLHERVVTVCGPGAPVPRHLRVKIGTLVTRFSHQDDTSNEVSILRGGLFTGTPVDPRTEAVQHDDDCFFFLPIESQREFLQFTRLGWDRVSALPCYLSRLTGGSDKRLSNSLRGELRPCIACGVCEKVCPADLMPQVIHRYLYAKQFDESEMAGLNLCVNCGLCTYVCPSKIELMEQFIQARAQFRQEREAAQAAVAQVNAGSDGEGG